MSDPVSTTQRSSDEKPCEFCIDAGPDFDWCRVCGRGRSVEQVHCVNADGTCGTCGLVLRACWCGKEAPPWAT